MKRKCLLFILIALVIIFSNCSMHRDLNYLKNKFPVAQRDSIINEFFCSDSLLVKQYRESFVFNIYMFAGENCNVLSLDPEKIDTSLFSDNYFKEKQFIIDFIEKDKSLSDVHILVENTYLYNTFLQHTQMLIYDARNQCRLYDCFPQRFYDLIGSLIYNRTLDYVFAYPTRVTYDEELIGTDVTLYFGVKGKKVYIIIDNWTSENQGNDPRIIPIEEYLNCCWDKMTNVTKK